MTDIIKLGDTTEEPSLDPEIVTDYDKIIALAKYKLGGKPVRANPDEITILDIETYDGSDQENIKTIKVWYKLSDGEKGSIRFPKKELNKHPFKGLRETTERTHKSANLLLQNLDE